MTSIFYQNNRINSRSTPTSSHAAGYRNNGLENLALVCPRVSEDVQQQTIFEHVQLFARRTTTEVPFWISVHDENYDKLQWSIMLKGSYYERMLTNVAMSHLNGVEPSLVMDVGSNIGWLALLAGSLGHHVFAFEPNPANQLR